ncbi:hypothetical protein GOODEAATRI_021376, partial [Goodea atripinnis]
LKERRAAANTSNALACQTKVRAESMVRTTLLGHAHMKEALGRHSNMKYSHNRVRNHVTVEDHLFLNTMSSQTLSGSSCSWPTTRSLHLQFYTVTNEQSYIICILFTGPVYGFESWFCLLFITSNQLNVYLRSSQVCHEALMLQLK